MAKSTSRSLTGSAVKSVAGKVLSQSDASKPMKSLASSVLAQGTKSTGSRDARTAAKVLASPTSGNAAKTLAGSVLSQSKKPPFPVKTYRVAGSSLTQKESAAVVRQVVAKKK